MKKIQLPIESSDEDNINPSHPDIWWLVRMSVIVIWTLILAVWGSYIFSYTVLAHIDLETEKRYFWGMMIEEDMKPLDLTTIQTPNLNDTFSGYTIYIQPSDEENAFATLGGNIIITSALLEKIENEEELIFILRHEFAHIENRDVIQSIAQSMPIILTLQSLWIDTGNSMTRVSSIINNHTSREKESKADDISIIFLENTELNPLCATKFFERHWNGFEKYTTLLSTHPSSEERLQKLRNRSAHKDKKCTPMKKENSSN